MTTNLNPVMYGSGLDAVRGLLRALPDPGTPAYLRWAQTARRFPRMARVQRPALAATCEVAGMLADRVGAPSSVPGLLAYLMERWDGKGPLGRAEGEQIRLPMRIVHVSKDAAYQRLLGGWEHAARLVRERSGRAFDLEIAACLLAKATDILTVDDGAPAWDDVLALEPRPHLVLEEEAVDPALGAMGSFADLVSPYFSGHSLGVARLAGTAAEACGIDAIARARCSGRDSSTTSAGSPCMPGSGRSRGR